MRRRKSAVNADDPRENSRDRHQLSLYREAKSLSTTVHNISSFGGSAVLAGSTTSRVAETHDWHADIAPVSDYIAEVAKHGDDRNGVSPATSRSQAARRNSLAYRLGMDYLLAAHDPILLTLVAQMGSSALCSPNGIRTRVATLRERAGPSIAKDDVAFAQFRTLALSDGSVRLVRFWRNSWAIGWANRASRPGTQLDRLDKRTSAHGPKAQRFYPLSACYWKDDSG
jgi:hypothetical protein